MRIVIIICITLGLGLKVSAQTYRVGAKHFNEGYILSEMLAQLIENDGYLVERKFNLGGTTVCYEALRNGAIDMYPEYTGSLAQEILKSDSKLSHEELEVKLKEAFDFEISPSFGFSNTYALAVTRETARAQQLNSISELDGKKIKVGLSYEFLKRKDGWENLKDRYQLDLNPVGMEHSLAYKAIADGTIQLTDVYSTDGEISRYGLMLLKDDLGFFPDYSAVAVFKAGLDPTIKNIAYKLENAITEEEMQAMNAEVLFGNRTFSEVARSFLIKENLIRSSAKKSTSIASEILEKTGTHLSITSIALLIATLVAVPLGILLYIFSSLSRPILYVVGLLQTIPSIALLALMIPLLGIGKIPAITALFLYALLPILRNTTSGLGTVDPILKNVAKGMGMTTFQRLRYVELPLAMPSIISGIRIAAVVTIGTATLAAFIGAGGLGEFIVTGLALNNTKLILQGAIPAAGLAIVTEFIFERIEKILIPRHLRG